jgi:hypothetical protein
MRTRLGRFQVTLCGLINDKKSGDLTLQWNLELRCNAYRAHSNLPKRMRNPFCLLQGSVLWRILQPPGHVHAAFSPYPSPCTSHLSEAELVLYIWCVVVHISPTSPEVDAPQSVRMNYRKLTSMSVDDKLECVG